MGKAGIIAAKMSKKGVLGYVASFPIPEVISGINATMLGAQTVNPNIKVKIIWVNSWFDPGKEADAAKVLIGQEQDLVPLRESVFQHLAGVGTRAAGPTLASAKSLDRRGAVHVGDRDDLRVGRRRQRAAASTSDWIFAFTVENSIYLDPASIGRGIGRALLAELIARCEAGHWRQMVAVIGDSTFYHTGLPALANVAYNRANVLIVILDNRTTAMTGHQANPGTGITLQHQPSEVIELEPLVRALGIHHVVTVDAYDVDGLEKAYKDLMAHNEPAVLVARRECALLPEIRKRWVPLEVVEEKCTGCGICYEKCPVKVASEFEAGVGKRKAIYVPFPQAVPKFPVLDPDNCTYFENGKCKACEKLCPPQAIRLDQQPEEITVKVLGVDVEKQKISLGLKQLSADPWSRVSDLYQVGLLATWGQHKLRLFHQALETIRQASTRQGPAWGEGWRLDRWDDTAKITYDRAVLDELFSLRFVADATNAIIMGPVGVGKTFLATALAVLQDGVNLVKFHWPGVPVAL